MTNKTKQPKSTSTNKSAVFALVIGTCVGIALSIVGYLMFMPSHDMHGETHEDMGKGDKPLYWVAPMDPNFKRDRPGKSPMGMDLIPVYEENSSNDLPGTVSIDPVTIQNLGVKTTTVQTLMPNETITVVGQVQFAQDHIQHVHPRISGWLETLKVRSQGDFIAQGEPLYSIYSPELVNTQEEFVLALRQKNPALINAAKTRLRALAVTEQHIAELEKTRKVSQTITALAPISGYIKSLNVQQGMYVEPGMTMLSIASLETVWVIADVFPRDVSKLSLGQSASITSHESPGKTFEAKLAYLYPTLNERTRTVQARFVLDNPQHVGDGVGNYILKPNMFANVQWSFAPENDAILAVPKQAVIRSGKHDRVVLALGDGQYKSVQIQIGRDFDDVFEVLYGLDDGDEVVISAQFLLDSESSITSDFMRMIPTVHAAEPEDSELSAWTQATVNDIDLERRRVNLSHGYLDAFEMMGMTMDFTIAHDIDVNEFVVGETVHVEIIRESSGMFQVRTLHRMKGMGHTKEHRGNE